MSTQLTLAVIMDPIATIHPEKDTTLALLASAQQKGFKLYYLELSHLFWQEGMAWGYCQPLQVYNDPEHWYALSPPFPYPLYQFNVILMRKDPPVDLNYWYATYILEHAEKNGALVINKPQGLRDANEKFISTWFPHCMPPTLVSSSKTLLKAFIQEQEKVILKPLDGMGGKNVFKCDKTDPNQNVMIDLLTQNGTQYIMSQRFLSEVTSKGDKRIFLIDGEPLPFALSRIPAPDEFRANLAAGGYGKGQLLTERDRWICKQIGPVLREKGLTFVGIDVIGEYLTEINVTSPTCVKEVESAFKTDIAGQILDCIIQKLNLSGNLC